MNNALFIAGTDTGVGKTVLTGLLGWYLLNKGFSIATQKWVQTGDSDGSNDFCGHLDIMGLTKSSFGQYSEFTVPYSFSFPASPHLAAKLEDREVSPEKISKAYLKLAEDFDIVLVEGTGGLLVPLSEDALAVDIVSFLELEVLLVVGNRLGAINHTLLTLEALKSRGIKVLGMVFNRIAQGEDELILKDNRRIISKISGVEDFGELTYDAGSGCLQDKFIEIGDRVFRAMNLMDNTYQSQRK